MLRDVMMGDPKSGRAGCLETQRSQAAFLKTVKKALWMIAAPLAVAAAGAAIAVVRHLITDT